LVVSDSPIPLPEFQLSVATSVNLYRVPYSYECPSRIGYSRLSSGEILTFGLSKENGTTFVFFFSVLFFSFPVCLCVRARIQSTFRLVLSSLAMCDF
jgi:hypothetical protein